MGTVGRVSPTGVTRQAADATTDANVGLRSANPTQLGEQMAKGAELDQLIRQKLGGLGYEF